MKRHWLWSTAESTIIAHSYINWVVETCGYQYVLFILLLHTSWCLIFILKLPIKIILLEWWQHEFSLHHYFIYLNIPSIRCYIFQTCLKKPKCQAKLDLIYVEFHESFSPSGLQLLDREVILFKKRAISSLSWFYHLVYLPKEFGHMYVGKLKL